MRNTRKFSAGKNLIIGDFTLIDSLSYDGIILGDNVTIERMSTIVCTGVLRNKGKGVKIGNIYKLYGNGLNSFNGIINAYTI